MVVYADVLIVLNLFVNFFILQLTARICRENYRFARLLLGAMVGALFSLYIFLPVSGTVTETVFRLVTSAVITLIAFGFDSIKSLFRRIGVFFAASFLYAGCMMGIWAVFKPERLAINNGVVYIDISPTVLILTTFFCYGALSLIRFFSKKQAYNGKRCKLKITLGDRSVILTALIDTGHSLTDNMTDRSVIIVEQSIGLRLLDTLPTLQTVAAGGTSAPGFRMIPYSSIGGHGLLPAFIPDKTELETDKGYCDLSNILLAVSNEPLGEDYKAIVSPDVLENHLK